MFADSESNKLKFTFLSSNLSPPVGLGPLDNLTMVNTRRHKSRDNHDQDSGPPKGNPNRSRSPSRENHVPRNSRNSKTSDVNSSPILSNNIYNNLQMDTGGPEVDPQVITPGTRPTIPLRQPRLPPFIIKNKSISYIKDLLDNITTDKKQVSIVLTKDGTKIYLQTEEHYKLLRTLCDDVNKQCASPTDTRRINYTAHPLSDEKVRKFVLYGLHEEIEMAEIEYALKEVDIYPIQVSTMKVNKPRYENHANFLLTFKVTDNMTLEKLSQVRAIGYLRVRFDRYFGSGNPPRCLFWSHGSSYCGMPPRCCKCGGSHASDVCPLRINKEDPKSRIPDDKVRCANCDGNHPANYKGCKKLQTYRKTHPLRQRIDSNTNNIRKAPANNIPVYNTAAYQRHNTSSYRSSSTTKNNNGQSWANVVASESDETNESLLSAEQMINAVQWIHQNLKSCKTRSDQIMTIMRVCLELLSNDSP